MRSTTKEILNKCKDKKDFPAFFTVDGINIDTKTEILTLEIYFWLVSVQNFHIA